MNTLIHEYSHTIENMLRKSLASISDFCCSCSRPEKSWKIYPFKRNQCSMLSSTLSLVSNFIVEYNIQAYYTRFNQSIGQSHLPKNHISLPCLLTFGLNVWVILVKRLHTSFLNTDIDGSIFGFIEMCP